jgi:hypothetical protein
VRGKPALAALVCLVLTAVIAPTIAVADQQYVKIAVHADATLAVDGQTASLALLDNRLAKAKAQSQTVMYWRDDPTHDPSEVVWKTASGVLNLVEKYRLPICFAKDPMFSGCRKLNQDGAQ